MAKVVPNYIFYLHENFQYFPHFLSIFLAWKIEFGVYLNRRNSHHGAHLSASSSLRAGAHTSGISFHLESMPSAAPDNSRQLISMRDVRSRQPLSIPTTPMLSGAPHRSPAPPSPSTGPSRHPGQWLPRVAAEPGEVVYPELLSGAEPHPRRQAEHNRHLSSHRHPPLSKL
jgi:hypothetical protein